jgi:16S rRNA (uracil1498-N3)-methyltransferase
VGVRPHQALVTLVSLPRFYAPDLDPESGSARLGPEEAHHLTRVLRLVAGDLVTVFNGRGVEWRGRVNSASREAVTLSLLEPVAARMPQVVITLAQAVIKGEAMEDVVRDSTMIGVAAIQPVISERTTVKRRALAVARDRWRRIALASAKQCGTARVPEILEPMRFDQWLPSRVPEHSYLLIEPGTSPTEVTTVRQLALVPAPSSALLLVGPEGGWTESERDAAIAAGAVPLSLGPLTLRANAVALAAGAALIAVWQVT